MATFPVQSLKDTRSSKLSQVHASGDLRMAQALRLVGATFDGAALDANYWSSATAVTGTVTPLGPQVTLQTGAGANASASVQSVRNGRYMAASINVFRAIVRCSGVGDANNSRKWGAFNANDGFYFELTGASTVRVNSRRYVGGVGVDGTPVAVSGFTMDTNLHTYEIWLANKSVFFLIDDALVATLTAGTANPLVSTMHLYARFENANTGGGTADVILDVRVGSIMRIGKAHGTLKNFYIAANGTYAVKASIGYLARVTVNRRGTVANQLTLYDNTAAAPPVIAVIDCVNAPGGGFNYELTFYTGLTAVLANNAAADLTIIYD